MANRTVRMHVHELASRTRTTDVLLTTPTPAESDANALRVAAMMELDLGKIWDGIWQTPNAAAAFDALPDDVQGQLLEKYGKKAQQLADYARMSGASSPLTSVTTITDRRATAHDGAQAAGAMRDMIRSINSANAAFNSRHRPLASSGAAPNSLRGINEANQRFWAERNAR